MNHLPPSHNPEIPQPGRTFWKGAWRTPEQIERYKETGKRYRRSDRGRAVEKECEARRIRLKVFGTYYTLPDLETREFALQLREQRKEERR